MKYTEQELGEMRDYLYSKQDPDGSIEGDWSVTEMWKEETLKVIESLLGDTEGGALDDIWEEMGREPK